MFGGKSAPLSRAGPGIHSATRIETNYKVVKYVFCDEHLGAPMHPLQGKHKIKYHKNEDTWDAAFEIFKD